jgi:hypothetical protein
VASAKHHPIKHARLFVDCDERLTSYQAALTLVSLDLSLDQAKGSMRAGGNAGGGGADGAMPLRLPGPAVRNGGGPRTPALGGGATFGAGLSGNGGRLGVLSLAPPRACTPAPRHAHGASRRRLARARAALDVLRRLRARLRVLARHTRHTSEPPAGPRGRPVASTTQLPRAAAARSCFLFFCHCCYTWRV